MQDRELIKRLRAVNARLVAGASSRGPITPATVPAITEAIDRISSQRAEIDDKDDLVRRLQKLVGYAEGEIQRQRADIEALRLSSGEARNALDGILGHLILFRKAIEAGDPKRELLIRIEDMERRIAPVLAATAPETGGKT